MIEGIAKAHWNAHRCIGVAPPQGQAYRSGYLGSWGGNMDYNEFREGVTLYLPVYQPGALLFLGDGHAAQGNGELTGDARRRFQTSKRGSEELT